MEDVNARVGELVTSGRLDDCFDVFAALTSRFDFAADDGADEARRMLGTFGGDLIVHGHSIIGLLTGRASAEVTGPLAYADGLVLAIDGGRYDGGPLLLVSAQA